MSNTKIPLVVLLALQVIAFLLYPPAYFARAPQASVMPPALLLLFILAIVGLNTRTLTKESTRNLLIFLQGINLVVRIMSLFPNLRTPAGDWAWGLLATQIIGAALAWYTMVAMERQSLDALLFNRSSSDQGGPAAG